MIITGSWQMRFTIIKKKLPKKQARNIQDPIAGQDHAESLGLRLAATYKTLLISYVLQVQISARFLICLI